MLPFLVLGRALLPGKVLSPADNLLLLYPWKSLAPDTVPANFLLTDATYAFHPWLIYAGAEVAAGRFPLWNPHVFAGVPFFASWLTAQLFPLNALAWVLPTATALTLISILKLAAAGLAMYWFLRTLALAIPAAVIGALGFMLSGTIVTWLLWPIPNPLIAMPLMLGATWRVRSTANRRWIAALGLVIALDLVAGYPQIGWYGLVLTAAWAAVLARHATGGPARFLARVATGAVVGGLLASVQILPALEATGESAVAAYRREWLPFLHLPARALITFLMPFYYGSPTTRDFWGDLNFNTIAVSIGVVPWVVLPLGLAACRRHVAARFFLGVAMLAGAMAYGLPGIGFVLASLPPFSWGTNLRINVLMGLALSVLAALGVDALARSPSGDRRTAWLLRIGFLGSATVSLWFVASDHFTALDATLKRSIEAQYLWCVVLLFAATLAALGWLRSHRPAWWIGLVGVQLASLLPLAATYNPVTDARWLYPETPALLALRTATAADRSRVLLGQHNVSMLYGLFDATGYDAIVPRRLEEIAGPIGSGATFALLGSEPLTPQAVFRSPAVQLLGIRHFFVPPGAELPPDFVLTYNGPDGRIYRHDAALPRAFVVGAARCVGDATALHLIWTRAVDFRREVLLGTPCAGAPRAAAPGQTGHAEIREYDGERVVVDAVTEGPGYLVLTDLWFPGWWASVDGIEAPIWRADHAFRAVWISPGRHRIEFRYSPRSLWLGLVASAVGASAIVALWLAGTRGGTP
jgi:hypothetical protein